MHNFAFNLDWDATNLIVNGLTDHASGVLLFNLALDQKDGPRTPRNGGCPNCRGVVTINTKTKPATLERKNVDYYVLLEAAKAFSPGAVVMTSTVDSPLEGVAARNLDGSIGLFVDNPSNGTVTFTVNENSTVFSYTIPPTSVASFRWTD